jgi:hypothetical protein
LVCFLEFCIFHYRWWNCRPLSWIILCKKDEGGGWFDISK